MLFRWTVIGMASILAEAAQVRREDMTSPVPAPAAAQPSSPVAEDVIQEAARTAGKAVTQAKEAAVMANHVATQSVQEVVKTQEALSRARGAVRDAQSETAGLSSEQRHLLRKAEQKLRDATMSAEYGKLQQAKYLKAQGRIKHSITKNYHLQKLETKLEASAEKNKDRKVVLKDEMSQLRADLEALRQRLEEKRKIEEKGGVQYFDGQGTPDTSDDKSLLQLEEEVQDLEGMLNELQASGSSADTSSRDELKAEIERLREAIERLEAREVPPPQARIMVGELETQIPRKKPPQRDMGNVRYEVPIRKEMAPLPIRSLSDEDPYVLDGRETSRVTRSGTGVYADGRQEYNNGEESASSGRWSGQDMYADSRQEYGGEGKSMRIDVDTEMPYGELEPFGREDTAQELTEGSIRESDEMVDQLERAEVAEEKRAVFRALTRLRGAAITSFDGVARSQTGNIDEYNKIHKWRRTHPLHHLADEESDISKWAFPTDAD